MRHSTHHRYQRRQNRPQLEPLEEKVLLSTVPALSAAAAKSAAIVQALETRGGFVSTSTNPFPRARFVTQLYETVLGRAPESSGLAYWVHELQRGVSPAGVRSRFLLAARQLQTLTSGTGGPITGTSGTGTATSSTSSTGRPTTRPGQTTAMVNTITLPLTDNSGFAHVFPAFGNAPRGTTNSSSLGTGSSLAGNTTGGTSLGTGTTTTGTTTGGTSLGTGTTTTGTTTTGTTTTGTTTTGTLTTTQAGTANTGAGFGLFPVPLVAPGIPGLGSGITTGTGTGTAGTGTSGVNNGTDLTGTGSAGTGTATTGTTTGTGTNTTGA